jgi:hypothetical protein
LAWAPAATLKTAEIYTFSISNLLDIPAITYSSSANEMHTLLYFAVARYWLVAHPEIKMTCFVERPCDESPLFLLQSHEKTQCAGKAPKRAERPQMK